MQIHRKDWDIILVEAVWDYNITHNKNIGLTPFELVFGKKVMLPIEFGHKTLKKTSQLNLDITKDKKEIFQQLNQLDELRQ